MANILGLTMLALGRYRFGVWNAAYHQLRRSDNWRWETQIRIGTTDALQFTGTSPSAITLDGVVYPTFRGGLGQIAAMRTEADRRTPLRLISGSGENLGRWVIAALRENQQTFLPAGAPKQIAFSLELRRYS